MILLNSRNELVEGVSSNIFLRIKDEIYTPALNSGCLAGVMRQHIIDQLDLGMPVKEKSLKLDDLQLADEVFFTNSIQGVKWVGSYQNKRYFNHSSKAIMQSLQAFYANLD